MYIDIDDATYHVAVQGEGPPVVLLHGFTSTMHTWDNLVHTLKKEFTCITIDLPGHGKTVTPDRTMEQCCTDLAFMLQKLQFERVHMVGYSMGGRVALSFAELYPTYISSLTLESASPGLRTEQERFERKSNDEKLARKIEHKGIRSFVAFWENIPLFATQKRLSMHVQESIRVERMSQKEAGLAMSLRQMGTGSQPSWWDRLVYQNHPTLLLVGAEDEKFVRINKEMASLFPRAILEVFPQAGHTIHIEQPARFMEKIQSFLHEQQQ